MSFGRPQKPIDWDLVDQFLEYGCSGTEIAPHFNMHYKTFYDRVQEKYGVTFTEYAAVLYEKGNTALRKAQYEKALDKDNTMLIWLGKTRLKQKEEPIEQPTTERHVHLHIADDSSNSQQKTD